jgi:hypothetical protein
VVALGLLAGCSGLCHCFTSFRSNKSKDGKSAAEFNATNFATNYAFWNDKLLKSLDRAADAGQVLAALAADPQKARMQFGRTLGISSSTLFFLRGTGRVVSVTKKGVALAH